MPEGFGSAEKAQWRSTWEVSGLSCSDCAVTFEKGLERLPGVARAEVSLAKGLVTVWHGSEAVEQSVQGVARIAGVRLGGRNMASDAGVRETNAHGGEERSAYPEPETIGTAFSGLFIGIAVLAHVLGFPHALSMVAYAAAIASGGWFVARSAWLALRVGNIDINLLTVLAVAGAVVLGEWQEGALVIFLFAVGETLESWSFERSRRSIRRLMDLAPATARVLTPSGEMDMPAADVGVGVVAAVKPGERIPLDGLVVNGESTVNQAPITGESLPVAKRIGDQVFAGTLNERGYFEFRVTRAVADTTLARITQLVEEAQEARAPAQRFVDAFSRYYTPAIFVLGILVAVIPPLFFHAPFQPWLYKGLTVLLVACPCALVLSTPITVISGVGNAARHGILLKGGVYLEQAGRIKAVAFDKTGTLTVGAPRVTEVLPLAGATSTDVLALAAAVESASEHPLAAAVLAAAKDEGIIPAPVLQFEAITGKGAVGTVGGEAVIAGSQSLVAEKLGSIPPEAEEHVARLQERGNTVILVARGGTLAGLIGVADPVRPEAREAIRALKEAGVQRIVMLTGDNRQTAEAVARQLGIDEVNAGLLPEGKLRVIEDLHSRYGVVAMVGDGINDAPALAAADIGVAMGIAGSDTALETAGIALMSDDLAKLADAIKLSRATVRTIRTNIIFALATKALAMLLIFPGLVTLWMAVLVDTGASILVSANGMRLLGWKERRPIGPGTAT